ncbi:MAG: hypothetical protein LBC35_02105 [Coriobacteriales bacterium]|nr:hypothetical protein [Coriobacteriales bacterium]
MDRYSFAKGPVGSVALILVCCTLFLPILTSCAISPRPPEDERLPEVLKEAAQSVQDGTLELSEYTDFEWDSVYAISQYANFEEALAHYGIEYARMRNSMNDGYLLVFCLDSRVVTYCNVFGDLLDSGFHTGKRSVEDSALLIRDGKIAFDGWVRFNQPSNNR